MFPLLLTRVRVFPVGIVVFPFRETVPVPVAKLPVPDIVIFPEPSMVNLVERVSGFTPDTPAVDVIKYMFPPAAFPVDIPLARVRLAPVTFVPDPPLACSITCLGEAVVTPFPR